MTEFRYKEWTQVLEKANQNQNVTSITYPIYLIWGDEFLCKQAIQKIIDILLTENEQRWNVQQLDGDTANIRDIIEQLNTYSFLDGFQVIVLHQARVLESRADDTDIFEKITKAVENKEIKNAAKYFGAWLCQNTINLEDIHIEQIQLPEVVMDTITKETLEELIDYLKEHPALVAAKQDDAEWLSNAFIHGFAPKHILMMTTDTAQKQKNVYKAINTKGVIIDCQVPKGDSKADRNAQEIVLKERIQQLLKINHKQINPDAYQALCEITGFNLRIFESNIEKLISYIGDRQSITKQDIIQLLQRTKKDPLFELTGAIGDRQVELSLFYLSSLLSNGFYPLQIVSAIANQLRKLLLIKDFMNSPLGKAWYKGMSYPDFEQQVVPAIQTYDQSVLEHVDASHCVLQMNKTGSFIKKKLSQKMLGDCLIGFNRKSWYPIYQLMLRSERFTQQELIHAYLELQHVDVKLKSTQIGLHQSILEEFIIQMALGAAK
ncbi:MAG: hypothetical protein HQK77_11515 [Desulfobacterales bacterium]|nr:hypothetical protein [Desulfobacterales bacterium]